MFLKIIPIILIIVPIIGFFVSPESISDHPTNAIQNLTFTVITFPWWGKLLSIIVGIFWLIGSNSSKSSEKG